ncbi:30S ribosomal protein S1 [soil metagenome]
MPEDNKNQASPDQAAENNENETSSSDEPSLRERVTQAAGDAVDAVRTVAGDAVETATEVVSDVASAGARKITGGGDGASVEVEALDPEVDPSDTSKLTAFDGVDDLEPKSGRLGYTGEIIGRVITLAELNDIENQRDPDEPIDRDEAFLALLDESMTSLSENVVVTGTIVAVREKEYVIDVGGKSDGVVSKGEFDDELAVGDQVEVFLERLEDRRGQLMLSKTKADDAQRWDRINGAFDTGGVIEGTIVRRIKGGMIVNLLGAEAFLPGSQVDVRPVRDFDAYIGRTMEFKVVKTNPANGNVVVSHKALIEKDLEAQRQQILDTMEVGQVLEGQVKNIVNFGVFIDLGGVDGLLHITDLSWGRVGHPSEVVELDQRLNVVVLDYDKERQRISLGYKQLLSHPWEQIAENYAEGTEVEGRVVSITDYGAFVEIEKGIEGLVHISEMSWTEHVKHPTQKVQLGQMVKVKLLKIDQDEKKISLGMKQLEPDPWEGILERYPMGSVTNGVVRNLTTFGAFVELEQGIDGLVHVSDLSWTKRVKHPSEVVRKGQELEVQVLDIDIVQRRISLGHKQVQTDPWQQYTERYAEGTETTGKVVEITESGLIIDLPLEAEGFVPAGHLERTGRPSDAYRLGDEIDLSVLRLDRNERQIILSETAKRVASERAERMSQRSEQTAKLREERRQVDDYSGQSRGPATIGELSGLAGLRDQLAAAESETPQTTGTASTQMEDRVGAGTKLPTGKDLESQVDIDRLEHETEPPAKQRKRKEDTGVVPGAESSQGTLKGVSEQEEGSLAAAAEDSINEELPTMGSAVQPSGDAENKSIEDAKAPETLNQPADRAVKALEEEAAEKDEDGEEKEA